MEVIGRTKQDARVENGSGDKVEQDSGGLLLIIVLDSRDDYN